jgi:hypothetical protein
MHPLTKPIPVYNIDGTANNTGMITDIADIIVRYENHLEHTQLAITHLGKHSLIWGTTGCAIITRRSTSRQKMSKCLAAHYNVRLAELKISVRPRYGSQQLPRSTYTS